MRAVRGLAAAVFAWLLAVMTAGDLPRAEVGPRQDAEAPEQKIARLERTIADQEGFIALLMENLANCTEENESLAAGMSNDTGGDAYVGGAKIKLLDRLRTALRAEENLGFLNVLSEAQLASLLSLIEGMAKRDGADGLGRDGETQAERPKPGTGPGPERSPK